MKATSALWCAGLQTHAAQGFSLFVFGGPHGYAQTRLPFANGTLHLLSRADVSGQLSNRINFYQNPGPTNW